MEAVEKFELIKLLKNQLDEYIQKKADFLAEITTEPLATTKSAFFYRDVMMPFITNTLLTDNLARNEGIGYTNFLHNRLRIRVFINGKELKARFSCSAASSEEQQLAPVYTYPEELPYTLRCIHASKKPPGIPDDKLCKNPAHALVGDSDSNLLHIVDFENGDQDVEIELPGPLGEYAFYAFLENLIRNAAKHNKDVFDKEPDRSLDIVIRVAGSQSGEKKDFFELEVFDNVSKPFASLDARTLLEVINELLKHRIIDEDFANLVRQAWGIAEMKICAMLLKGMIDFEELEHCLTADSTTFEGKERLCYKFDLMEPKKLCAVAPALFGEDGINDAEKKVLERSGIWIFEDVTALAKYLNSAESIASFRFCLFDCNQISTVSANDLDKFIHKLPFRIVISQVTEEAIPDPLKQLIECGAAVLTHETAPFREGPAETMSWLWQVWLRRWLKQDGRRVSVEVFLDQEKNLSPSKDWIERAKQFNATHKGEGPVNLCVRAKDDKGKVVLAAGQSDSNARQVFFDRHGGALSSLQTEENFLGEHSYIFIDKLNSDFVRIFHPTFQDNWLFPYELAEAGMLGVLIVDERMAERCLREVSDSNTLSVAERFTGGGPFGPVPLTWHLAFGAKLYIVTHFGFNAEPTPLHRQSYEQAEKKGGALLPFLKMKVEGNEKPYKISYEWSPKGQDVVNRELAVDALIIHQGILDQLKKIKSNNFLSDIRQSIPFVVVDSGRGIPPSLPPTAKFLPFSVLQDYVVGKRPAKYGLTQVTMALTRRKQND